MTPNRKPYLRDLPDDGPPQQTHDGTDGPARAPNGRPRSPGSKGTGKRSRTARAPAVVALERDDGPHRLARLCMEEHRAPEGLLTLRFWSGEWHRWDGRAYRPLLNKELRAGFVARVKAELDRAAEANRAAWSGEKAPPQARPVTTSLAGNVMQAAASMAVLPEAAGRPAWIGEGPAPFPAGEVL